MKLKYNEKGRVYYEITAEEADELRRKNGGLAYSMVDDNKYAIAPPDCKHELKIAIGCPRNIKYCTKCIYWTFTYDEVCHGDTFREEE